MNWVRSTLLAVFLLTINLILNRLILKLIDFWPCISCCPEAQSSASFHSACRSNLKRHMSWISSWIEIHLLSSTFENQLLLTLNFHWECHDKGFVEDADENASEGFVFQRRLFVCCWPSNNAEVVGTYGCALMASGLGLNPEQSKCLRHQRKLSDSILGWTRVYAIQLISGDWIKRRLPDKKIDSI